MIQHITAIYENGVLKPLQPLDLANEEVVAIAIHRASEAEVVGDEDDDEDYMPMIAKDGDPNVTWEEIQALLAHLPGSLAEEIIRDRGERL